MRIIRLSVTWPALFLIIFTGTNQTTVCFAEYGHKQHSAHIQQFPCNDIRFAQGTLRPDKSDDPNCHDFIFRLAGFSGYYQTLPPAQSSEIIHFFLADSHTVAQKTGFPPHWLTAAPLDFKSRDLLAIHSTVLLI